jgi:Na+/proline symporter
MWFFYLGWLWLVLAVGLIGVAYWKGRVDMNRLLDPNNTAAIDPDKTYPTLTVKVMYSVGAAFAAFALLAGLGWGVEYLMRGIESGMNSVFGL